MLFSFFILTDRKILPEKPDAAAVKQFLTGTNTAAR